MPIADILGSRPRRALLALLFYAAVTMLLASPLPLHIASTVPRASRPDVWLNVWALAWTSEHLLADPMGLFDANIFFPHTNTLAYTDHFIAQALVAAPVTWVGGGAELAYNIAWYAALVLTGWGGFLWARCLLGDEPAGEAAALVAGAVCLMFPGKRTALSHLQVISLQGVTFSLFAAHQLLKGPSGWRALGLFAAATYAALSSWYTAAYAALLLPAVGVTGSMLEGFAPPRRRAALYGAAALLATVVVMYPVAIPYRAVQAEMSLERPLAELIATSLRPIDFVSSWSWLHEGWLPTGSGAGGYFPGLIALFLGLIGLRVGWRDGDRWPLAYGVGAVVFAVLALGPRYPMGDGASFPLPYALLYEFVPGFGALRNPYRAAFIATILFSLPVGYGAREVINRCCRRWTGAPDEHPRLRFGGTLSASWAVATVLSGVHLLEAWPGPQEVLPLPPSPSGAYAWLADNDPGAAALAWPLPRPFDDNARYQLWTIAGWTPLVNGHSGLYPADFLALYQAGDESLDSEFVTAVKEAFPVRYLVAHHDLGPNPTASRAAAAANGELEEVFAEAGDTVYRVASGTRFGWARRRLPIRDGTGVLVKTTAPRNACVPRLVVQGETTIGARLVSSALEAGGESVAHELELDEAAIDSGAVWFEVFLVDDRGRALVDLQSSREAGSALRINGAAVEEGPAVIAVIAADTGGVRFSAATAADDAAAGGALRAALDAARPGDEIFVAIAESEDRSLIERLRLLLERAGAAPVGSTLDELGSFYTFRGVLGAAAGSATETFGESGTAPAPGGVADDCRLGPIVSVETRTSGRR